jgi:hypothetical protein
MSQWVPEPANASFENAFQLAQVNPDSSPIETQMMELDLGDSAQPVSQMLFPSKYG